jgi:polyisoprenoid-binding protein YceI
MKNILLTIVLYTVAIAAYADSYTIDPAHTYPNFTINHLGFSTMHGRFGKSSGTLELDQAKGTGSVEIVVDMASVNTGFKKRDDHLRSPDFFNAIEFPTMTFKSTKVVFKGKGAVITGNLTIKGVTKSISLEVPNINCGVHPFNKKHVCGFDATTSVKRSDFGIKYGLPAIGDEMNIEIEVEAVKN